MRRLLNFPAKLNIITLSRSPAYTHRRLHSYEASAPVPPSGIALWRPLTCEWGYRSPAERPCVDAFPTTPSPDDHTSVERVINSFLNDDKK